ncbi:reverse transcriptase [Tanacetum coccineum]
MINAPPENCLLGKVIADNHIVHKQSVISNLSKAWKNHNLKTLNELEFDRGEFWIQVHDLPLGIEYATELAKSLGKPIELDFVGEGAQTDLGTESWVSLKYERLSDFCYRCGCLGHGHDSCTNEVIAMYAGKWSSEMRAKMVRRLQTPTHHPNISRFSQHLASTVPHLHHKSTQQSSSPTSPQPVTDTPHPYETVTSSSPCKDNISTIKMATPRVCSNYYVTEPPESTIPPTPSIPSSITIDVSLASALSKLALKCKHDDVSSSFSSGKRMKCLARGPYISNQYMLQTAHTTASQPEEQISGPVTPRRSLIVVPERKRRGHPKKNNVLDNSLSNILVSPDLIDVPIQMLDSDIAKNSPKVVVADLKQPHDKYLVGRSGGLALCSPATPAHLSDLSMCFVYAPHDRASRAPVWDAITQRSLYDGPCLVIGDFNLIDTFSDKYTWSNQHNEADNIHERIDRAVGNINLFEVCPFQTLIHKRLIGSDHAPLIYSSHPTNKRKWSRFRFESLWTTHEEFENTIRGSWPAIETNNQLLGIRHNLSQCASKLKRWSQVTFGNNKRKINDLTREIKIVQMLQYTPENFR